jgi:NAD(P)-dependent dehydrogenase (short-subunit alcohol dehydrogenase family)
MIVTGANSGIGFHTARALASAETEVGALVAMVSDWRAELFDVTMPGPTIMSAMPKAISGVTTSFRNTTANVIDTRVDTPTTGPDRFAPASGTSPAS